MADITEVVYDWQKASDKDRTLIREEAKIMNRDLNKAISKAIEKGEAHAAATLESGLANVNAFQRAMQIEIKSQVERMADGLYKTIHENRNNIANNYLSLKGYAGCAQDTILDYIQKGNGKGLSAIGDFLQTVAIVSAVKTKAAEGLSAGSGKIEPAFGGDIIPEVTTVSKVNGLVDEYSKAYTAVSQRWPYGLGKYLLSKLSTAMTKGGVLSVG